MTGIYLDHAATTPMRPGVSRAMGEVHDRSWGNPSSPHDFGRAARRTLDDARARIGNRLGYAPREIHFVRGGTEANNLAILGRFAHLRSAGPVRTSSPLGVSVLEHSSVAAVASHLQTKGVPVLRIPFDPMGRPDEESLASTLEANPGLLSIQAVNSECGLCLPVEELLDRCTHHGVPLHVDGAQAMYVKLPEPAGRPLVLSISGHKLGGPRSTAVLAIPSSVGLAPLLHGGPQEFGLRPGTEDVAGAMGLAHALDEVMDSRPVSQKRLGALRDRLEGVVQEALEGTRIVGRDGSRTPHIAAMALPGIETDVLLAALDLEGVAASAGSACRSGSSEPGPAFRTLLGPDAAGLASLRLSLGWNSTPAEVDEAAEILTQVIRRVAPATSPPAPSTEVSPT